MSPSPPPPTASRHRPSLSITLPPALVLPAANAFTPRTPDQVHADLDIAHNPNAPPRQAFRVRRRAPANPYQEQEHEMKADLAIPTIEMTEATYDTAFPHIATSPVNPDLLPVDTNMPRMMSQPRTPTPRLQAASLPGQNNEPGDWSNVTLNAARPLGTPFRRSNSVCSSFSDSSMSSDNSGAYSSLNTSPDRDQAFAFGHEIHANGPHNAKRMKFNRPARWTPAMDEHLWMTYLSYLADPLLTPFKMVPGMAPPLGVSSRVARKARQTWGTTRQLRRDEHSMLGASQARASTEPDATITAWPTRECTTRRRLKVLATRQPDLHAHYQRLLRTRSPSPFESSSTASQGSTLSSSAPFSSRDLNVSLTTATAASMQPEGPLAQFARQHQTHSDTSSHQRPADWFARIPRSHAHQTSLSMQAGLNLMAEEAPAMPHRRPLNPESPAFTPHARDHLPDSLTRTPPPPQPAIFNHAVLRDSMRTTNSLGRQDFQPRRPQPPTLLSPVELQNAPTITRSLKRRFKSDEEKPRRTGLDNIFGRPNDEIIKRGRGYSVDALPTFSYFSRASPSDDGNNEAAVDTDLVMTERPATNVPTATESTLAMPSTFAPSATLTQPHALAMPSYLNQAQPLVLPPTLADSLTSIGIVPQSHLPHSTQNGYHTAPRQLLLPVSRLGSPFAETLARRQNSTFPRGFIATEDEPRPFERRLREIAARLAANDNDVVNGDNHDSPP